MFQSLNVQEKKRRWALFGPPLGPVSHDHAALLLRNDR